MAQSRRRWDATLPGRMGRGRNLQLLESLGLDLGELLIQPFLRLASASDLAGRLAARLSGYATEPHAKRGAASAKTHIAPDIRPRRSVAPNRGIQRRGA